MSYESAVANAKKNTKSIRATIPEAIVKYLDLESGDKLEWKMEGSIAKPFVTVRKAKG
ncbi:MAG: hypothetical protein WA799_08205 [Nitrosotalea sp.]